MSHVRGDVLILLYRLPPFVKPCSRRIQPKSAVETLIPSPARLEPQASPDCWGASTEVLAAHLWSGKREVFCDD